MEKFSLGLNKKMGELVLQLIIKSLLYLQDHMAEKTTTLRMIVGLEKISKSEICIDNVFVNNLPVKDEDISMPFRNYALYS